MAPTDRSNDSPDDGARERAEQRTLLMPRREAGAELPPGTALQEFVVERTLGVGGYSVVYLALDTKLDRRVALKEYLPGTLAARLPSGEVAPRLPRFAAAYDKGLQSFLTEARLLGQFDHPSLVKVYRFWPDRGTAYMAMPYYEGITLKRWLADLGAPPSEKWLRALVEPLARALAVLHAQRCLHRDVAPDNILMLVDRQAGSYLEQAPRPLLLDFGAARRVAAEATQQLTAILKSGYSPIEQYDSTQDLLQGPWTDVYALAALLYAAVTGRAPPAAIARAVRDELVPARVAGRLRYSQAFLSAIDAGLAVRPEQRPQDMATFLAWFDRPEPPAPDPSRPVPSLAEVDLPLDDALAAASTAPEVPGRRPRWLWPGVAAALLALAALLAWLLR
jgi:serine/threonine protein kinase